MSPALTLAMRAMFQSRAGRLLLREGAYKKLRKMSGAPAAACLPPVRLFACFPLGCLLGRAGRQAVLLQSPAGITASLPLPPPLLLLTPPSPAFLPPAREVRRVCRQPGEHCRHPQVSGCLPGAGGHAGTSGRQGGRQAAVCLKSSKPTKQSAALACAGGAGTLALRLQVLQRLLLSQAEARGPPHCGRR